jgi:putative oxidoreductase
VEVVLIQGPLAFGPDQFGNGWGFTNPNGGWEYPIFLTLAALALALLWDGKLALKRSARG